MRLGASSICPAASGYTRIRGVDQSPQQVALASELGIENVEEAALQEALARQESGSVDSAIMFDVIEHVARGELLALCAEVLRVLKPGGRWIIHTCNAGSPFFGAVRYGDLTHELAFTDGSITRLLLTSGFCNVRCFEDRPVLHGAKSAVRRALWTLIRALLRLYDLAETGASSKHSILSRNFLVVATKPAESAAPKVVV